jgi:hypothetical protein
MSKFLNVKRTSAKFSFAQPRHWPDWPSFASPSLSSSWLSSPGKFESQRSIHSLFSSFTLAKSNFAKVNLHRGTFFYLIFSNSCRAKYVKVYGTLYIPIFCAIPSGKGRHGHNKSTITTLCLSMAKNPEYDFSMFAGDVHDTMDHDTLISSDAGKLWIKWVQNLVCARNRLILPGTCTTAAKS